MELSLELYRSMFISLKRGNHRGMFSNAKPMFLLALIYSIPNIIKGNFIEITNLYFNEIYKIQFKIYAQGTSTPIEKPLYHLHSEPFYELIWKDSKTPEIKNSPSAKFLREYLAYAKLDDDLWELLQDEKNREYLKNCIIEQYLKVE